MSLTGTNKRCAQCIKACKQWANVKIIRCPFFKSNQQESAKAKEGGTLQVQQNQLAAHSKAIFEN